MVRSIRPGIRETDSAREDDRRYVDTERLVGRIVQRMRSFDPALAEQGRRDLSSVKHYRWVPKSRAFVIPVAGSDTEEEHRVTLSWSDDDGELRGLCSRCGASPCQHVYSALYHLYSELSVSENSVSFEVSPSPVSRSEDTTPWSSRLAALDQILASSQPRDVPGLADVPLAKARILWNVVARGRGSDRSEIDLRPFEQKRTRAGTWGRARKVSWAKLLASPTDWSTAGDVSLQEILNHRYSSGNSDVSFSDSFDVLAQLVGHPEVYFGDELDLDAAISVVEGSLSVSLSSSEDGSLDLRPAIDGRPLTERDCFKICRRGLLFFDPRRAHIVVVREKPSRLSLLEHLLREELHFPPEAREELLQRLAALQTLVAVDLPPDVKRRRETADPRIHVLLTPVDDGIRLRMRVCPLAGGDHYLPAEGPDECGRLEGNTWITTRRRHRVERETALELADSLALDRDGVESEWRWRITPLESAFDVLRRLASTPSSDAVVKWPEGRELELKPQRIGPSELRVQITEREDLFGLEGFVKVDDAEVLLSLLLERAREGSKYLPLGENKWAEVSDELLEKIDVLSKLSRESALNPKVDRSTLPLVEETLDGVGSVDRCGPWQHLLDRYESADERLRDQPPLLRAELRPYQSEGYRWMTRLAHLGIGACLADDMGLGKTVQTLGVLSDRALFGPTLVVAPTSVTFNWKREAARFAPNLTPILYRETDRKGSTRSFSKGDLVIVSYGLLRLDIARLSEQRWGTVVLDEAQHIKNSRSQTSKAVSQLDARWRLALSGTPIENHLGELWSLFRFLSPRFLGSWESFRRNFAEPIERHDDEQAKDRLASITRPFILRRKKSEVLKELPPRTDVRLTAVLSEGERKLYEDARLAALARLSKKGASSDENKLRFDVLAALTKLRQLSCHPGLVYPDSTAKSTKLELLLEILDDLKRGGHRALIFSQFTSHLKLIREELSRRGITSNYLDGQTSAQARARQVDDFQNGDNDVFLISLRAGGTGLNLTAADYVIHMDPWWNPAVEDQATDRAHRMGQKRPVTVYRLVAENTVEQDIARMQERKRNLLAGVMESAGDVARMSTDQLVDLIRISSAARAAEEEEPEPETETVA
ncbi:MAG: DEAD/DEAH box helicase [Planctomycetota bacterium]